MLIRQYAYVEKQRKRRSKALAGRPAWQDVVPDTPEGRKGYAIAAKHERAFARTFLEQVRGLLTPDVQRDFKKAYKSGLVEETMRAIPFFNAGETDERTVWRKFLDGMQSAYTKVIQEAGDDATRRMNRDFKVRMKFTLNDKPPSDEESERVVKARKKKPIPVPETFEVVPVNPYSIEWMEENALELARQGISDQQRTVVRSILEDNFSRGIRAEEAYKEIEANIGLTDREYRAVRNRRQLHLDAGLSQEDASRLADKYRQTLLKKRSERIARTETIKAQAQGRRAAWQMAQDERILPAAQRRWIAPPETPNPNRPCDICLDLDGKTALLGEPYESAILGMVEGPPSHPSCRCVETLERI